MTILVTGGAGYIGSHTVAALQARGDQVVVLDNLQTGHKDAVRGAKLIVGDIRDDAALDRLFAEHAIDAVIHFAANSLVGESMQNPGKYYDNNVYGTLKLLEAMNRHDVKAIVFSSTAATYGEPESIPIQESDRTLPTNAYGETKLAMEKMMRWFDTAHGVKSVSLRYFNAAGALSGGEIGEDHDPETHLIPVILQVPLGKRAAVTVFGDDYDTPDGTCIRDYLHVSDLAQAHLLAVDHLLRGGDSDVFNLGSGTGFSVLEVIETARKVTGHPIPANIEGRRAGDPAKLIASSEKIKRVLGWKPQFDHLETIIFTAWAWHRAHPDGYGSERS